MSLRRERYLEAVIAGWEDVDRQKDELIEKLFDLLGAKSSSNRPAENVSDSKQDG